MNCSDIPKLNPTIESQSLEDSFDWELIRDYMMTSNARLKPDDPSCCVDVYVKPDQLASIRSRIRLLFQSLRLADFLGIRGGYAGQRAYNRAFLLDDQYITGIFDDRSLTSHNNDTISLQDNPKTLSELMYVYSSKKKNLKTLIVLEKSNCRLAISDERGHQSRFLLETIYPALAAISEVTEKLERLDNSYLLEQSDYQITEIFKSTSRDLSVMHQLFRDVFENPKKVDDMLFHEALLEFLFTKSSVLNVNMLKLVYTKVRKLPANHKMLLDMIA